VRSNWKTCRMNRLFLFATGEENGWKRSGTRKKTVWTASTGSTPQGNTNTDVGPSEGGGERGKEGRRGKRSVIGKEEFAGATDQGKRVGLDCLSFLEEGGRRKAANAESERRKQEEGGYDPK